MKRFLLSLFVFSAVFGVMSADELTSKQRRLRNEIVTFLKTEGFMPSIDSDGDIEFKSEGATYWISIDSRNTSPMYLSMFMSFGYGDTAYTQYEMKRLPTDVTLYKAVKLELYSETYRYSSDMYLTNAETFNAVFYTLLDQIKSLKKYVSEQLGY